MHHATQNTSHQTPAQAGERQSRVHVDPLRLVIPADAPTSARPTPSGPPIPLLIDRAGRTFLSQPARPCVPVDPAGVSQTPAISSHPPSRTQEADQSRLSRGASHA